MEKHELKPGEICPYCGQKKRGKYQRNKEITEERKRISREAGKKGGRPINPNSKRQIALRKKAEKEVNGEN